MVTAALALDRLQVKSIRRLVGHTGGSSFTSSIATTTCCSHGCAHIKESRRGGQVGGTVLAT